MNKKIEIGQNGKIWVLWKVKPTDYTDEARDNIKSLMAKKYGIKEQNVKVDADFSVSTNNGEFIALNSTMAESIQDPKFQQELMSEWIKINKIEDCDFDEIIKIDSRINSLIDYSVYEKSKRYKIKWVKWDNFLSYGSENYLDFTTLNGLVLLNGEPANESGKSTFAYDLLHFLLFGKTNQEKAKTNDQLFNNYRPTVNEVSVEGCINIEGEDYVISRILTKKKNGTASQKVYYYKLLENGTKQELIESDNLEGENTAQTNKIIKEALGNEKDFDLIISANSKDLDELISIGDTDRGKILSRWIGLSPLEDKEIKAKEARKQELSKGRYCDLYNQVSLEQNNIEILAEIDSNKSEIKHLNKRLADATSTLEEYNKEKDNLLISKIPIDCSILQLDMSTLEHKLNDIIEKGKNDKARLESVKSSLIELGDITYDEVEYKNILNEKDKIVEKIAELRSVISQLKETNKILESQEYCPTCGRKFENIDNSKLIEENKKKIESMINDGVEENNKKKLYEERIIKIEQDRKLIDKRSKLEIQQMAINSEINDGRILYKETKELINKLIQNKDAIIKNNEIDTKINLIKTNISTQERIINDCNYNIAVYTKNIDTLNENIKKNNGIIAKIIEEAKDEKYWNLYLKLIGKDGISKMVLRHSLPIINAELKNLLNDCADFEVIVSINEMNTVEFSLVRDGVTTRLSAASGLERTQASLALRVVLGKMSKLSCPPFILLDEVLGTVAAVNYDNMKKLYDKITSMYDFVLHITHLDAISDWHDMTLTIVKNENISSVKPLIIK